MLFFYLQIVAEWLKLSLIMGQDPFSKTEFFFSLFKHASEIKSHKRRKVVLFLAFFVIKCYSFLKQNDKTQQIFVCKFFYLHFSTLAQNNSFKQFI